MGSLRNKELPVPRPGFEPGRRYRHRILSAARLPIPPAGRIQLAPRVDVTREGQRFCDITFLVAVTQGYQVHYRVLTYRGQPAPEPG